MSECEGCPVAYHVYGFQDNRVGNPKVHKWYPNDVCRSRRDPCHLTPDHQRIINAMIRGVFDCGHCDFLPGGYKEGFGLTCSVQGQSISDKWFCPAWQEHEEGEDG